MKVNHDSRSPGGDSNRGLPEYKSEVIFSVPVHYKIPFVSLPHSTLVYKTIWLINRRNKQDTSLVKRM
jgi:hypothetical protein